MKRMLNKLMANKVTLAFVFVWFTLIPFALLALLKSIFNFGFLVEFPIIVIMEIFMVTLWTLIHKTMPSVKAEIMCNDKDVLEGSYDYKDYKGEA